MPRSGAIGVGVLLTLAVAYLGRGDSEKFARPRNAAGQNWEMETTTARTDWHSTRRCLLVTKLPKSRSEFLRSLSHLTLKSSSGLTDRQRDY